MTSEATFGKALTYTYDAASNLASMAWPDGVVQANTIDGANRLTSTGITGQAAVSVSFGYDAVGRMTALTRGNGANSTLAYDCSPSAPLRQFRASA
jgi:YD repeat-containing protein